MPNQLLQNSILTTPLVVGAQQGMPMQQQQAVNRPQVDPQEFVNRSADFAAQNTPESIQSYFPPPAPETIATAKKIGLLYQHKAETAADQEEARRLSEEQHPARTKFYNFLRRSGITADGVLQDATRSNQLEELQAAQYARDLGMIHQASQVAATKDPAMIEIYGKQAERNMKLYKDFKDADSEAALRGAQGEESGALTNLHNVEAQYKPTEVQNEQNKTAVNAGELYFKLREAERKYQADTTKDNAAAYSKAQEDYIKGVEANTKIREENRIRTEKASEQVANPSTHGMVPKHPGFNMPPLKTLRLVPPTPPPPSGTSNYLNTPQDEQLLNMAGNISGMGAAKPGQSVMQSPPPTTPSFVAASEPPPSLVQPQRPIGAPLVPGLAGGIPGSPGGQLQIQQRGQSQGTGQQQINPNDVPIPISAQQAARGVPQLNQEKAQLMLDMYRGMVAAGHPEVEQLTLLMKNLEGLKSKLAAKR